MVRKLEIKLERENECNAQTTASNERTIYTTMMIGQMAAVYMYGLSIREKRNESTNGVVKGNEKFTRSRHRIFC